MNAAGRQWRAGRAERLRTLWRLGPRSVARVARYRIAKRLGVWVRRTPPGEGWSEPVFRAAESTSTESRSASVDADALLAEAEEIVSGWLRLFSGPPRDVGDPPRWHTDPYDAEATLDPGVHWSRRSGNVTDIKTVWEMSRFVWAPTLARAWRETGDERYIATLQQWTADWTRRNPANLGPNWECGQETSLRMLHVLIAAHLLGCAQDPEPGLVRFVREHVQRVGATTGYAVGQDNNHGTSEAAALFVGGTWLAACGDASAHRIAANGRGLLEERVAALVESDGSFSQYSVNYHRVLLDTLSIAEWWRRELDADTFSDGFYARASAATEWLYELTDPVSGDAPNIGANDGAMLLGLSSAGYRDYRPSVQLAAALFCGKRAYESEAATEMTGWLDVDAPEHVMGPRTSRVFADGGWVTLHAPDGSSWACVRFPSYRFRPGHADALHFDLWGCGVNLIRDAGTFSYAADEPWQSYFPGTAAHSTVEFDGRDQMPRIGRFLFGAWTKAEGISEIGVGAAGAVEWTGAYRDARGCRHQRTVRGSVGAWTIIDVTEGARQGAVARWRLWDGDYEVEGAGCSGPRVELSFAGEHDVTPTLAEGYDSRFYFERESLAVLEVDLGREKTTTTTTIRVSENMT